MHVRDKQQKIPHKHREKTAGTHQIQPERHLPRNPKVEAMFPLEKRKELWEKSLSLNTVGLT